ncbi:Nif3-like dinuclear metal center hexameric protein [Lacticaseibacillus paracasei]|uniref:Nif3-like dinuclear metal center hexameric protein n=1 Tax=Lacticaseibacillus paracasei TaxID=1597 RepID=UPI002ADEB715|nr:Nif3-like dinuclear metal center hexameric protein [Lacticaseibacillus paracasei]MEA0974150.1 Nif3-like dinuclear metal center hexameric protein [Lacticaseibacillus paracasei]
MKIQSIIDTLKKATDNYGRISPKSIDQLIIGDSTQEVTGIATTFMATVPVIKKAIENRVNFIITHEPTWANGHDRTERLQNDPVYQAKRKLIKDNKLVIWRFHDHMHFGGDHDMVVTGVAKALDWTDYLVPADPNGKNVLETAETCFEIPEQPLADVMAYVEHKLGLKTVRFIGNPKQRVSRIAALIGGASLGLGDEQNPIEQMRDQNIDLAICGDITEWTLAAYVRDAVDMGFSKSMVVIGHERSEEPGMHYLTEWVHELTQQPVQWIDAQEPWHYETVVTSND